ncbi:uncharacterized protein LOC111615822 [Centruroides sculpturatus]|uniref:uncharacterized protein LOC111615822 n=1 Tax=Centruroides sculpturatus TaxID=218467 RepID=UPI000C6E986C|nr:uncharacterized protein LOC111615822 [Centruroides sculpturatus]
MQTAHQTAQKFSEQAAEARQTRHRQQNKPPHYQLGDRVLLKEVVIPKGQKQKLAPRWSGPYRIIEILGPVNFKIENINTKRTLHVHADRIKPTSARQEFNLDPETPTESLISTPEEDATEQQQHLISDPWDEFIFSSIPTAPPEGFPESEDEGSSEESTDEEERESSEPEIEEETGSTPPYALRSQGPVADQPWVMPRPTRSRIPRFISPTTSRSSSP